MLLAHPVCRPRDREHGTVGQGCTTAPSLHGAPLWSPGTRWTGVAAGQATNREAGGRAGEEARALLKHLVWGAWGGVCRVTVGMGHGGRTGGRWEPRGGGEVWKASRASWEGAPAPK